MPRVGHDNFGTTLGGGRSPKIWHSKKTSKFVSVLWLYSWTFEFHKATDLKWRRDSSVCQWRIQGGGDVRLPLPGLVYRDACNAENYCIVRTPTLSLVLFSQNSACRLQQCLICWRQCTNVFVWICTQSCVNWRSRFAIVHVIIMTTHLHTWTEHHSIITSQYNLNLTQIR